MENVGDFDLGWGPVRAHGLAIPLSLMAIQSFAGLGSRALAISEKALGPYHPNLAAALNDLSGLQRSEGPYGEAEPLMKRTLAINEKLVWRSGMLAQ
jgi:hypothetical protein